MADVVELAVNDLAELERGFDLSLRARNRSPKTIQLDAPDRLNALLVEWL